MVFLSIWFLLCCYKIPFFVVFDTTNEAVVFIDLVIKYSQSICAFISSFYLVISMLYIEHTNEASKQRKTMPH